MKSHKNLDAWKVAMDLAKQVYQATNHFPPKEQFGLVSQMRRCAVSIPSNIAEGAARQGTKEFIHFLHIALGSCSELDTQIEIAMATNMADGNMLSVLQDETTRTMKLLSGLIRSLKSRKP